MTIFQQCPKCKGRCCVEVFIEGNGLCIITCDRCNGDGTIVEEED